jgi:hypothetical protein
MWFDVCIIVGQNERGRDKFAFSRVRYEQLSEFVRNIQDRGMRVHIISLLVPLHKKVGWQPMDVDRETFDSNDRF